RVTERLSLLHTSKLADAPGGTLRVPQVPHTACADYSYTHLSKALALHNHDRMADWWKRWWKTLLKLVLAAAILVFVGRQFHDDLSRLELSEVQLRPGWMLLSAGLYLTGLTCSMWFWRHLLGLLGPR